MTKAEGNEQWGNSGVPRRVRKEKVKQRTCLAACSTLIDGDSFMCRAHWNKVPAHIQAGLRVAMNEDRQTDFDEYLKRARDYAAQDKGA